MSISRRRFSATVAAGGVYTAFHQLVGVAAPSEQAPRQPARQELCEMSAVELAARLARKQVSAREVMTAHLAQIERVNPKVNAIVTLVAEQAMAGASRADEAIVRRDPIGVLHGLPVAHKDLVDTAGIRTTRGSPFYRDHVPTRDALIVTRIRAAGAITVGKTNTPEFGAGSQTFNTVFGATRNPYDLTKTCGGSSGGAATAVAARMLPIADGSDTGGSLRNPPAFCNVVGLRPSPGRVASESTSWSPLSVSGPIARTVADVALFLSAIAGPDPRSPLVDPGRSRAFPGAARKGLQGRSRGVVARSRRDSLRARDPPRRGRQSHGLRGPRLRRRGSGAGLHRYRRSVSVAALRRQSSAVRAAHPAAAGVGEGHDQVRSGAGGASNRGRISAERSRDRRACTTRAASSSSAMSTSSCR